MFAYRIIHGRLVRGLSFTWLSLARITLEKLLLILQQYDAVQYFLHKFPEVHDDIHV